VYGCSAKLKVVHKSSTECSIVYEAGEHRHEPIHDTSKVFKERVRAKMDELIAHRMTPANIRSELIDLYTENEIPTLHQIIDSTHA
jgi:hypothetical protein